MGKFANQKTWDQFRPLETAPEIWEEPEPPLSVAERAAQISDLAERSADRHFDRIDAEVRLFGGPR